MRPRRRISQSLPWLRWCSPVLSGLPSLAATSPSTPWRSRDPESHLVPPAVTSSRLVASVLSFFFEKASIQSFLILIRAHGLRPHPSDCPSICSCAISVDLQSERKLRCSRAVSGGSIFMAVGAAAPREIRKTGIKFNFSSYMQPYDKKLCTHKASAPLLNLL